jgi:hypothetical protein
MARKVKDTPVLTGEDARRFEKKIAENASCKVSREEHERAEAVYKQVMAASSLG